MIVKFTKEYVPAVLKFLEENHVPENGLIINCWLLESLCYKIHNDNYDPIYLHFSNNLIDGIVQVIIYDDDDKERLRRDFCLNLCSNNYAATVELLNMPFSKGKVVNIDAESPYVYQHLLTYFKKLPFNPARDSFYIYFTYDRKPNFEIDYSKYDIREIPYDSGWENDYLYGLFVGDKLVSKCVIQEFPKSSVPQIKKHWCFSGLETEEEYRRKGYASVLTSYLTNKILERGGIPLYWAVHDNIASQRNAMKCGFSPIFKGINFTTIL